MDILGLEPSVFFAQLVGIILADLALGGDNAIVIGMACRNLPERIRLKGIILGTVGAVVIRIIATVALVVLMNEGIILVRLVGGIALIYIGCKLMVKEDDSHEVKAADSLFRAIITIVAADAVMGIDNVIAVGSIADGHFEMVMIGLGISIPIIVFGSTLVIRLMNRFPFIVYIGAAVILYAAGEMIVDDELTKRWFHAHMVIRWLLIIAVTGGGLLFGYLYNRKMSRLEKEKSLPDG